MSRLGIAIALGILAAGPQSARAEATAVPDALHAGATSIEFGAGNFDAFTTGFIGARRHWSPTWATRVALDLDFDTRSGGVDSWQQDQFSGNFDQRLSTLQSEDRFWRATAQALWYPVQAERFAFGIGAGPTYRWSHTRNEEFELDSDPSGLSGRTFSRRARFRGAGAALDADFEWFFQRRIALRGRTGVDLEWHWQSESQETRDYDSTGAVIHTSLYERHDHGLGFSTLSYSLGFAIYL